MNATITGLIIIIPVRIVSVRIVGFAGDVEPPILWHCCFKSSDSCTSSTSTLLTYGICKIDLIVVLGVTSLSLIHHILLVMSCSNPVLLAKALQRLLVYA